MFALQRVSLKSSLRCWPVQVRSSVAPAGVQSLGGCPPQSLSRPPPSRRGSSAGEEKTNMEKYLGLLIMAFRGPVHTQCRFHSSGKLRYTNHGEPGSKNETLPETSPTQRGPLPEPGKERSLGGAAGDDKGDGSDKRNTERSKSHTSPNSLEPSPRNFWASTEHNSPFRLSPLIAPLARSWRPGGSTTL